MTFCSEDEDDFVKIGLLRRGKKYSRPMGSAFAHYPNQAERKELARICQKSGLSPEEAKQNIVHRRALAQAQKSPAQPSENRFKVYSNRAKRVIAHVLKQPNYSKDVQKVFDYYNQSAWYVLRKNTVPSGWVIEDIANKLKIAIPRN